MVGNTPVMSGQGYSAIPDTSVGKVPGALGQGAASSSLIDLYRQANGRDLQRTQVSTE